MKREYMFSVCSEDGLEAYFPAKGASALQAFEDAVENGEVQNRPTGQTLGVEAERLDTDNGFTVRFEVLFQ